MWVYLTLRTNTEAYRQQQSSNMGYLCGCVNESLGLRWLKTNALVKKMHANTLIVPGWTTHTPLSFPIHFSFAFKCFCHTMGFFIFLIIDTLFRSFLCFVLFFQSLFKILQEWGSYISVVSMSWFRQMGLEYTISFPHQHWLHMTFTQGIWGYGGLPRPYTYEGKCNQIHSIVLNY